MMEQRGRARAAYYNQAAEKAYEKRNAEIAPWVEDGEPPNPDNAALLYYQAFLLRRDPNVAVDDKLSAVINGRAEPDRQVRTYLGRCLPAIEVAEIASRMPQCTWGIWPERGLGVGAMYSEMYGLKTILLVDAKALAADGHYRVALERCLTVRRLAQHLTEDSRLDPIARNPDETALRTVQQVLGVMPPDVDILTWLRGQFVLVQGPRLSVAEELLKEVTEYLSYKRTNPTHRRRLKDLLVEDAEDEQAKENARNLTDEQLLSLASEALQRFIGSICRILDSDTTYEQKLAEMQKFINNVEESGMDMEGMIESLYPSRIGHVAHVNGVKAAVEVYLALAKTGQLPKKLPDHLPKDPFTGRDFVYEITDEGFALRCQGEDFLRHKNRFLEFKVQR
jgi:hypothetical protein